MTLVRLWPVRLLVAGCALLLVVVLAGPARAGVPIVVEITPTSTAPPTQPSTPPGPTDPSSTGAPGTGTPTSTSTPDPDDLGRTGASGGLVLALVAVVLVAVGVVLRGRRRAWARALGPPAA